MSRQPEPGDRAIYPMYVQRRMRRRGILKAEVENVLAAPTEIEPSRHAPGRFRLTRRVHGRKICVVVGSENTHWVAITVWAPEEGD